MSSNWKPEHSNRYRLKKGMKELYEAINKDEEEKRKKKKGYPCDWRGRLIKEV